jgi:RNA polymerase sigma-70 factor (ECF subfamily)
MSRLEAGLSPVEPKPVEPKQAGRVAADDVRNDGTLLVRHLDGDASAFPELVARYRTSVYGYLVRMGVAREVRDDLFQDVFLRVHRAAARYQPTRPFQPWLFTIVANAVRNHLRGDRLRRLRFVANTPEQADPPDPAPDGERSAHGRQTVTWLHQAIGRLPRPQREVLILAAIEHQPLAAIGKALRIPIGTVKSRLSRARLALAQALVQRNSPANEVSS